MTSLIHPHAFDQHSWHVKKLSNTFCILYIVKMPTLFLKSFIHFVLKTTFPVTDSILTTFSDWTTTFFSLHNLLSFTFTTVSFCPRVTRTGETTEPLFLCPQCVRSLVGVLQEGKVNVGLEEARVAVRVQEGVDAFLRVRQRGVRRSLQQLNGQVSGLTVQVNLHVQKDNAMVTNWWQSLCDCSTLVPLFY